jgi:6-phosphofructokinase 2
LNRIFTLTVNPVVDKNTTISSLVPNKKLRCSEPVYYSGGGGVNVSRAINNLKGNSIAIHFSGGRIGAHLQELLSKEGIEHHEIDLVGTTRENLSVFDTATDLQYRFGLPGPKVNKNEWQKGLDIIERSLSENDFLVVSGKLTSGIPDDYYMMVGEIAKRKKAKFVLDTKEGALKHAIKTDIFLFKPNLSELASLYGKETLSNKMLEESAKDFMATHKCEILAVSLGRRGALLVTSDVLEYIPAPIVHEKNTIGAGDSMLAGMLLKAQAGHTPKIMIQYGVASGAAATLRQGAQLCQIEDVERIYKWMISKDSV